MRHALHGGSTGADDADALVGEPGQTAIGIAAGVAVIPATGMEAVAPEGLDAGNAGQLWPAERTSGENDEARADPVAAVGLDQPARLLLLPCHPRDDGLKQRALIEAEVTADAAGVLVDLRRPRVFAHRYVAGLFQERQVDVALGIARRAGITIPVPGAAEVGGLFHDAEIVNAGFAQTRATEQPAKAAADDEHLGLLADGLARKSGIGPGVVEIAAEAAGHFDILRLAFGTHTAIALVAIARAECGNVDRRIAVRTGLVSFR